MPGGEVFFHLDYLKLTLFCDLESTKSLVEDWLQEPGGVNLGGWKLTGSAARWEQILTGHGGVQLLSPKDTRVIYTIVELKGQACTLIGAPGLCAFLQCLHRGEIRWHGLRADLTFDHVRFDPATVYAAIEAGNFNSRCLSIADRDWNQNSEGRTAYLGRRDQVKDRRLRIYDKRGYNRLEQELRGDWARSCTRKLAAEELAEWPVIALGFLRGMVDFVDRAAEKRADRCPLLPWWAELVDGVERIKNLPEEDRRSNEEENKRHIIGISESRIIRCAKSLWPILEAFGPDYLAMRIRHFAGEKITDEHRAFAERLKGYRYCGLAGLAGDPDDEVAPF